MTGHKPLVIVEDGSTFIVRGNGYAVLRDGGFRAPYNGVARGWRLDSKRLPDLCAYLEARRIIYTLTRDGEAA